MAIVVPVFIVAVVGVALLGAVVYFVDKDAEHRDQ